MGLGPIDTSRLEAVFQRFPDLKLEISEGKLYFSGNLNGLDTALAGIKTFSNRVFSVAGNDETGRFLRSINSERQNLVEKHSSSPPEGMVKNFYKKCLENSVGMGEVNNQKYSLVDIGTLRIAVFDDTAVQVPYLVGVSYSKPDIHWMAYENIYEGVKKTLGGPGVRTEFLSAASENTLEAWERFGIPPIKLIGTPDSYTVPADGNHRLNSAHHVATQSPGTQIFVPVTFTDNWNDGEKLVPAFRASDLDVSLYLPGSSARLTYKQDKVRCALGREWGNTYPNIKLC